MAYTLDEWSAVGLQYTGHIENGAIILDNAPALQNGVRVRIELLEVDPTETSGMPLRGTSYRYDDPFSPALEPEDWDAIQ